MKFTHLHVHSHYSLLDGLSQIPQMVDYAKELGMDSLAITDHGVLYGAVEFFKEAKKKGIKPIIGCEVYVAYEKMTDMRPNVDNVRYHLILLAKDVVGYKNLVALVSKAQLEGYYYKPRIDEELLFQHTEGLICLTACIQGKIPRQILSNDLKGAKETILKYAKAFGEGNFYLELQHHDSIPDQEIVNNALINFSKELNLPLVATNDSHYLKITDAPAQDILMCINTGTTVNQEDRLTMLGDDFSLRSPEQMAELFKHVPEAIENTQKIADACNFEFVLGETKLPKFVIPGGKTPNDYLRELCEEGLISRKMDQDPKARERMEYELSVINKTGFSPYFLIVQDFINWAKNNGVVVGPGRGSAAGSLVAYLINITNIDPFKFNLLFERFLNPERISMPDIDVDFADIRRDEVVRYVSEKYGSDHVAQIITFGTIAARVSIRDVGRVLDYPYSYCDKVAKMIPPMHTLQETIDKVQEFKALYESDPQAQKLIDFALQLEGVARHTSTHACGVVITADPLTDWVPLQRSPQDPESIITQYEMKGIEALGFLKMDFLGLRNLTIIENTLRLIEKLRGIKVDIDSLPEPDPDTFKLIQDGNTTSVFQLESEGMKRYLKQLKPTELEDIVTMNALYRPGPMEFIPLYIKRKHGLEKVTYLYPTLEKVLRKTYGLAIYQEQIMQIAQVIGGFSLAEADILRKAIGKKIKDLLLAQHEKFVNGAVTKNNIPKEIAEQIWEWILPFASYGFNKSHAAAYATIAYQTAYLKAHYPTEFMCSVLNAESGDLEYLTFLIDECKKMNIEILPPAINESYTAFTVISEGKIRFGLLAIKQVGEKLVEAITAERKANGKFVDMIDFVTRINTKDLNKKSMESMIKSGVFDAFEERNKLLANLEGILEFSRNRLKEQNSKQQGLFSSMPSTTPQLKLENVPPAEKIQKLHWEKELLGIYVSGHVLEKYAKLFAKRTVPIKMINKDLANAENMDLLTAPFEKIIVPGQKLVVGAVIQKAKKILTKKGEAMYFLNVEDLTDKIEVVVFPRTAQESANAILENKIVLISGKADTKDGSPKIIADNIEEILEV